MKDDELDQNIADTLCSLDDCNEFCLQTMTYCLEKGEKYSSKENISLLMDCSDICKMTESFLLRESIYTGDFLDLCVGICEDCKSSCEEFKNDKIMHECAKVCGDCAQACSEMVEAQEEDFEEVEK